MSSNPPEKKPSAGDHAWLFTKVSLFLMLNVGSLLVGVCTAVAAGGITFNATGSRLYGAVVGLGIYMATMGGRSWFLSQIVLGFFDKKDLGDMDKVIDDGKK